MAAEPGIVSGRLALRWLILGAWRAHPARLALTALAIAVGVALGFAVHLVNGSALASFEGAVTGVNGAAALQIRAATPLGFDETLYPRIATAPGVADASPVVRLDAQIGAARLTLLGLDVMRAGPITPSLIGAHPTGPDARGDGLFAPDALFLSRGVLRAAGVRLGQRVTVRARGRAVPFRVVGTLPGQGEQAIGTIDIAAAQSRFDRLGRLDRLDLALSDRALAERALPPRLPPGVMLTSGATQAAQGSALSRAYRVNLDMLALVALLTGGFLVFSAQSLAVARRLREFALLRTLGLPARHIIAAVVAEGLAIGLVGGLAGLAAGAGLARLALRWFGGDLGAGYFSGQTVRLVAQPGAAAGFFALGLAAAALGSLLPARIAARAAPAAALKNAGDLIDPRAPVAWKPALLLLLAGAGVALLPPLYGLPWSGFASMALLLAGGVAGVPWLARRLLAPWRGSERLGVAPGLALRHLAGAPSEAATALCGIVASTALTIAMATMVTSFRGAVDSWLGDVLAADLFVRADPASGFDAATRARLATIPGVRRIAFSRQLPLSLRPDRPPVTLIARPLAGGADPLLVPLGQRVPPAPGTAPLWVSEPAARLYGWRAGDRVTLPLGPAARFTVVGLWRDYARQSGALVIDADRYQALTGDALRDEAAILLAPGAQPDRVGQALRARLDPATRDQIELSRPAALRGYALALFDRSFAVTYALEAVAILVGLAGVAATMSGQTAARAREFGMLRHLGLAKRQILAMLALEGALLGAVGGLAGIGLGLVLAQVLIHVINPQSFHWTMATRLPGGTIAGIAAALIAAAAATAVLAGRRATARDALLAVREDW
ncbi:FtsX-like permease family protein [Sphingomonas morindae]|uniref:FtsX-like permease family protein n=1 Tax=Sphingomonas morindae TaxID=1541170 RepID=A0ABY4XD22_9SPHN|nr:FtsX-like permease family protein [Sphingomonas morindae]USI74813.1 FtsX-like permease family protein [Sphingomonas morindae]